MNIKPLLAFLVVVVVVLPACKTVDHKVASNGPAYAAFAEIKVKPNKTGNGDITLVMEHLAPPKRIDTSNAGYVAWLEVDGQDPVKLGALESNEKKRSAELHATTPQERFKIRVTLEKDLAVQAPVGPSIVDHSVVRKI